MNREQKAAVIDEIAVQIQESEAIFAVDYRGISVVQAAELRGKLRDADASLRVVKNTLTELAADKAGVEALKPMLVGPTALTFARGDAAAAAKAVADYARATQLLPFKGGVMGGQSFGAEQVGAIARLPSRDVLNAQLVNIVASPLTGLVTSLSNLISGLARQLSQLAEQKEAAGPATPEVAAEPEPEAAAEPEPEAAAKPEPETTSEADPAPDTTSDTEQDKE